LGSKYAIPFSLRQTLELLLSLEDKPNDFKTFQSFDGLAILALSWPFTKSHFLDLINFLT